MTNNIFSAADNQILCVTSWADGRWCQEEVFWHSWHSTISIIAGVDHPLMHHVLDTRRQDLKGQLSYLGSENPVYLGYGTISPSSVMSHVCLLSGTFGPTFKVCSFKTWPNAHWSQRNGSKVLQHALDPAFSFQSGFVNCTQARYIREFFPPL